MLKAITSRIKNALPSVFIHSNRTGYVKDRYVGETVRSIFNWHQGFHRKKNIPGLIFIDFRKALTPESGILSLTVQTPLILATNRPFPSSLVPLFQSESKCETILMKMTLICMKMKLHAELIFIWKVSHLDSFRNRGTRELGNGLFKRWISTFYKKNIPSCVIKNGLSTEHFNLTRGVRQGNSLSRYLFLLAVETSNCH